MNRTRALANRRENPPGNRVRTKSRTSTPIARAGLLTIIIHALSNRNRLRRTILNPCISSSLTKRQQTRRKSQTLHIRPVWFGTLGRGSITSASFAHGAPSRYRVEVKYPVQAQAAKEGQRQRRRATSHTPPISLHLNIINRADISLYTLPPNEKKKGPSLDPWSAGLQSDRWILSLRCLPAPTRNGTERNGR